MYIGDGILVNQSIANALNASEWTTHFFKVNKQDIGLCILENI